MLQRSTCNLSGGVTEERRRKHFVRVLVMRFERGASPEDDAEEYRHAAQSATDDSAGDLRASADVRTGVPPLREPAVSIVRNHHHRVAWHPDDVLPRGARRLH